MDRRLMICSTCQEVLTLTRVETVSTAGAAIVKPVRIEERVLIGGCVCKKIIMCVFVRELCNLYDFEEHLINETKKRYVNQ